MLVLTRKIKETLVIGENIRVTVLEVSGDQVKLGIDAPREVRVYRQEVFEAIQEANRLAAQASFGDLAELDQMMKPTSCESVKVEEKEDKSKKERRREERNEQKEKS